MNGKHIITFEADVPRCSKEQSQLWLLNEQADSPYLTQVILYALEKVTLKLSFLTAMGFEICACADLQWLNNGHISNRIKRKEMSFDQKNLLS